ncbi:SDR family NAD(P)-dependent oxidoreductase [Paracoccus binzhouensis]|uniref:SDR family NAD(P)-dependent oxidoreductase n=1 Tax=Paracoccus binzhouensis TaxID=2796149 RepID=UPI002FCE1E81
MQMDVTKQESIDAGFAEVIGAFGHLDILINNAALFTAAPIEEVIRPMLGKALRTPLVTDDLPDEIVRPSQIRNAALPAPDAAKRAVLRWLLGECGGNISAVARQAGLADAGDAG